MASCIILVTTLPFDTVDWLTETASGLFTAIPKNVHFLETWNNLGKIFHSNKNSACV